MRLAPTVIVFALVLVAGCSARPLPFGPTAQAQERALAVTWEGVYGMERESRPPKIIWWPSDGCGEDIDVTGFGLDPSQGCAPYMDYYAGKPEAVGIYVRWQGSFHASAFAESLVYWRKWLLKSSDAPLDEGERADVATARAALVRAAL